MDRVAATLSMAERGSDIAVLAHVVELRSWIVQPDRTAGSARQWFRPPSVGRAAIRAALPFYLRERGVTCQPLAPLTGRMC
jgi:hypothetical protein